MDIIDIATVLNPVSGCYILYCVYKYLVNDNLINDSTNTQIQEDCNDIEGVHIIDINKNEINSGVPIRNEISSDNDFFSTFQTIESKQQIGYNFSCLDYCTEKYYINDCKHLNDIVDKYHIDINKIPIQIPSAVYHFKLSAPIYKLKHNRFALIGTNKSKIINKFLYKARLPLTFTNGVFFLSSSILLYQYNNAKPSHYCERY